jgi:hypothetical protein
MTRVSVLPLVVALLAGCASVNPSPSSSPTSSPAPTESAAASVVPLDLSQAAFWRFGWTNDAEDHFGDNSLRVGLLDGTVTARVGRSELWQHPDGPIIRGPTAGIVLYGRRLAAGIEVHLVSAATGEDHLLAAIPLDPDDVEIAPGGDAIYWIDRTMITGGVWRLDVATGARTRVMAPAQPPALPAGGTWLAAAAQPHAELALSADGSRVAALWCGVQTCLLQVMRLGEDALQAIVLAEAWHELLGFAKDGVALGAACADPLTQQVLDTWCEQPDARARAAHLALSFMVGVELPAGWTFDVVPDPDAEPMSFTLQAVAIPDDDGAPIVLEALGELHGQ